KVIEDRVEFLVHQRQPMLHPRMTATLANRLVEEIVGSWRAKCLDIPQPEAPNGFACELKFGYGHEFQVAHFPGCALSFRIEAADGLQRLAEKVEPDRLAGAR